MDDETLDLDSRLAYTIHLRFMAGSLSLDSPIFETKQAKAFRLGYKVARLGNANDATRWGIVSEIEEILFNKGYSAGEA